MFGDCHIHMILDGIYYRAAIDAQKERVDEALVRARLEAYRDAGVRFFLLLRGGACLGLVSVQDDLIENLYVHPAHWHEGIGRQLLAYAESLCARPRLYVLCNNDRAIRIYTRAGYRFTGRENRLSDTLTEREMVK